MHTRGGQIQARGILRKISMRGKQDLTQAWNPTNSFLAKPYPMPTFYRDQASSDHRAWRSTALG